MLYLYKLQIWQCYNINIDDEHVDENVAQDDGKEYTYGETVQTVCGWTII